MTTRHRRRYPRRRPDHRRTRRRIALAVVLLVVVTVIATALRSGSSSSNTSAAIASVPPTQLAPNAPPAPVGLATAPGNLVLDVPVTQRRITAIVYHGVGTSQVIPLVPIGSQRNAGILSPIAKMLTGTPDGGGGPSLLHRRLRAGRRHRDRWTWAPWPAPTCIRPSTARSSASGRT